jgi:hypothetical protein
MSFKDADVNPFGEDNPTYVRLLVNDNSAGLGVNHGFRAFYDMEILFDVNTIPDTGLINTENDGSFFFTCNISLSENVTTDLNNYIINIGSDIDSHFHDATINCNNKVKGAIKIGPNSQCYFDKLVINDCFESINNDDGGWVYSNDAVTGSVTQKNPSNIDNCFGFYGPRTDLTSPDETLLIERDDYNILTDVNIDKQTIKQNATKQLYVDHTLDTPTTLTSTDKTVKINQTGFNANIEVNIDDDTLKSDANGVISSTKDYVKDITLTSIDDGINAHKTIGDGTSYDTEIKSNNIDIEYVDNNVDLNTKIDDITIKENDDGILYTTATDTPTTITSTADTITVEQSNFNANININKNKLPELFLDTYDNTSSILATETDDNKLRLETANDLHLITNNDVIDNIIFFDEIPTINKVLLFGSISDTLDLSSLGWTIRFSNVDDKIQIYYSDNGDIEIATIYENGKWNENNYSSDGIFNWDWKTRNFIPNEVYSIINITNNLPVPYNYGLYKGYKAGGFSSNLDGYKGIRDYMGDVRILIDKNLIDTYALYKVNVDTEKVTDCYNFNSYGISDSLEYNNIYVISKNKDLNPGDTITVEEVLKVAEIGTPDKNFDGFKGIRDDGLDIRCFLKAELVSTTNLLSINTVLKTVTGIYSFDNEGKSEPLDTNTVYILTENLDLNIGDIYTLADVAKVVEINQEKDLMTFMLDSDYELSPVKGTMNTIDINNLYPVGIPVKVNDAIEDDMGTKAIVTDATDQHSIKAPTILNKEFVFDIVTRTETTDTYDYTIVLKGDTIGRYYVYKAEYGTHEVKNLVPGHHDISDDNSYYPVTKEIYRNRWQYLIISSENLNIGDEYNNQYVMKYLDTNECNSIKLFNSDGEVITYTDFSELGDLVDSESNDDLIGIDPLTGNPKSFKGSGEGGKVNSVTITDPNDSRVLITTSGSSADPVFNIDTSGIIAEGGIDQVNAGNGISIPDPSIPIVSAKVKEGANALTVDADGLYVAPNTASGVTSLTPGTNITITPNGQTTGDLTISATGSSGGGQVNTVVSDNTGIEVDSDDPVNPKVGVKLSTTAGNSLSLDSTGLFGSGGGSGGGQVNSVALRSLDSRTIIADDTGNTAVDRKITIDTSDISGENYTTAQFLALYDSANSDVVASSSSGNKLTLNSTGSGGTGIQGISSNDFALTSSTGPVASINFKSQTGDITNTSGALNIGSGKVVNDRIALSAIEPKNILASSTVGQILQTTAANTVGWATLPTANNPTITFHQDGVTTDQTITLNQSDNKTINLISGSGPTQTPPNIDTIAHTSTTVTVTLDKNFDSSLYNIKLVDISDGSTEVGSWAAGDNPKIQIFSGTVVVPFMVSLTNKE